ncbi:uncharacterized protein LOC113761201 [Coffea eugenioides]|uniref:uncharacterized protein LOC113761201 n=1 Tax=Coffea eugenioides TaxID=49369 RepID=UPI000F604FA3|nr:uncharacterized protein LOC113761201 [Coffea eugenioides]
METTTEILHSSSSSSISDSSNNDNGPWSAETTWAIASGSLESSVTFDSSHDSPEQPESDSPRKLPPLILNPPAPDSGPCEIKLHLLQKYNIRQIYVRSTARVYEVYCAQSKNSGNEYLCTVRCSIAERDEQVLQAVNVEELSKECVKHAAVGLPEEKSSGGEHNAPSDDDWVEVKVVSSPTLENGTGSLSNETISNTERHIQDYYEATVEISDSDPCTSLIIRLLSLQNKGVVYIDEVYIYAELVDSTDSESLAPQVNGATGSSLMAMFVPTLLQMSKSCVSPTQGEQPSDKLGKASKVENLPKSIDVNENPAYFYQGQKFCADQQYIKLQDVGGSNAESVKSVLPNQTVKEDESFDPVVKNESPCSRIEKVLEQLVSRVSRIEEVCLRFEENMLKPINSMELRIQQVEQQLESLTKNSHDSGFPTGTRICAPSFSCESNSSSFHNGGSDCQPFRGPELERKEIPSVAFANPSDGFANSVNSPRFLPSLVVSVPEFSCGDDEQDDDVLESVNENNEDDEVLKPLKDSSGERRKIDDILAAALSTFLSSASDHPSRCEQTSMVASDTEIISKRGQMENLQILPSNAHEAAACITVSEEPPKYTQILTVTAPEFTSEENGGEEDSVCAQPPTTEASSFASKKSEDNSEVPFCDAEIEVSEVTSDSSDFFGNKSASDLLSISNAVLLTGRGVPNNILPGDAHSGGAHVQDQSLQESTTFSSLSSTADQAKGSVETDVCETIKETNQGQPSTVSSPTKKNVHSLGADVQNHFSKEDTTSSLLERCISLSADRDKNSVQSDVCQTIEKTGIDSDESKDVLEKYFGCHTSGGSHKERIAAGGAHGIAAEGPEKYMLQNVSRTGSLVDFKLPILDVQFAAHENCSTQPPLEALLSDLSEFSFGANSIGKGGGDLDTAKEMDNLYRDDCETIDPVTSRSLLVDLGIYDIVVSSDEESGLDDYRNTCNHHEMVASLI